MHASMLFSLAFLTAGTFAASLSANGVGNRARQLPPSTWNGEITPSGAGVNLQSVLGASGGVTAQANAVFTVPTPPTVSSSVTVGLECVGLSGGISVEVSSAGVQYQAWTAWLNGGVVLVDPSSFAFKAGDEIHMSILTDNSGYAATISMKNSNGGQVFTQSFSTPTNTPSYEPQFLQASWNVGQVVQNQQSPLMNFGTILFTGANVTRSDSSALSLTSASPSAWGGDTSDSSIIAVSSIDANAQIVNVTYTGGGDSWKW